MSPHKPVGSQSARSKAQPGVSSASWDWGTSLDFHVLFLAFFFFQVNKKDCIFSARWICFCHMVFSVPNELLTSCQLSTQIRRDGGRRVLYQSLPKLQTAAREPHSLGFDPMPPLAHMGGKVVIRLG